MIIVPYVVTSREQGNKMVYEYQKYTRDIFRKENVEMQPAEVKPEFQTISYGKPLKLMRIVPTRATAIPMRVIPEKIGTVTSLEATMFGFMRMYTLLITPKPGYNIPIFSLDVMNIGSKRVFVIEIIDPARIPDSYTTEVYGRMRRLKEEVKDLPDTPPDMPWAKEMTMDFSIHTKADNSKEQFFLDLYYEYLSAYLKLITNAQLLTDEQQSKKVQEGIKTYVDTLLEKGGPAVNVFKYMLGSEKQKEFVKEVMFGIEQ
jgi:hypothetical protein